MTIYKCHKTVVAYRILAVHPYNAIKGGYPIDVEEIDCGLICHRDMFVRYTPVPGDYYVDYGNYVSISPKKAFEDGYKKLEECEPKHEDDIFLMHDCKWSYRKDYKEGRISNVLHFDTIPWRDFLNDVHKKWADFVSIKPEA